MANIYSSVITNRPGRSVFNLSHDKKFDCDMGELIPTLVQECVPGDTFKIGNEAVARLNPLVAPMMDGMSMTTHYFFVPNRILFDGWEEFITGGETGETAVTLPKWIGVNGQYNRKYSLWDYFGLPVGKSPAIAPTSLPKRAYNMIWNEYYRSMDLQEEVDLENNFVLKRAWSKDYFTSALPFQQRGTAPALPIGGILPLMSYDNDLDPNIRASLIEGMRDDRYYAAGFTDNSVRMSDKDGYLANVGRSPLGVNLGQAASFDVSDLRLAFQVQKWLEANARSGVRYTEFLQMHFSESPTDSRLQRPEYIGGSKNPIIISEVLQTSSTDSTSPQGNLAGHGISAASNYVASYHVKEFGWILGLTSFMPKASYMQGVDRCFTRETRYDYYFPEFAHLSEQAILNQEIYADGSTDDTEIFGYQGRYNEMRTAHSIICGSMRDTLSYWHLGRIFSGRPNLNAQFIECNPDKRIFAVQNVPGIIVNFGNIVKAVRPMPYYAEPGLIDHK